MDNEKKESDKRTAREEKIAQEVAKLIASAICSAVSLPMAGAQVSPGDSIPAMLYQPSKAQPIIKSSVLGWARTPEKRVIAVLGIMSGTLFFAPASTLCPPLEVVTALSLSSMSSAVGPMSKLP